MGAAASNLRLFSSSDQERAKRLTKELVESFVKNYLLTYVDYLVEQSKYNFKNKGPERELKERPAPTDPIYEGVLTKLGAVRKNWKTRYFLIYPKGIVRYYTSKEEFEAKPDKFRGEIDLRGYRLEDDVEKGLIKKLKDLAKKLNLEDESQFLPDGKQYPDFTFELHHWKRRCWFMHPETEEEFKEWCSWMRQGIRSAWWYRTPEDDMKEKAFRRAIYKTRWEVGRWGWFDTTGPQSVVVSEMVADHIDYTVLSPIFYKFSGPWKIRRMAKEKVEGIVGGVISGAVTPAWTGVQQSIEKLTPTIQEQLDKGLEPLFEAEENLKSKIKDAVLDTITPPLGEVVEPVISKVMDVLVGPVIEAYQEVYKMFDDMTKEMAEEVEKNGLKCNRVEGKTTDPAYDAIKPMYYHSRSYWKMRPAYEKVDALYDPLDAIRDFLHGVWPWRLIWDVRDRLSSILENAVYTFQEDLYAEISGKELNNAALKEQVLMAAQRTMTKMKKDGLDEMPLCFKDLLKTIVVDPFQEKVVEPCGKLIEPLADLIPEPLQKLINPQTTFEDLLIEMIEELLDRIVDPILETKIPKE